MKCLMAVDLGDENTKDLIARAVDWVERIEGTLDLLFVDPFPYAAAHIHDPSALAMLTAEYDKLRDVQLARLNELLEVVPSGVRGRARRASGARPAELIVEAAASYGLLLVGTHGRTGLQGFFVGSVAERVVRTATVPTLVLRA